MSAAAALAELLERGGPVVAVLLALSVLSLAITLVKLQQFVRARIWSRAWLTPVLDSVRSGEAERALVQLRDVRNPIARVVEHTIRCRVETGLEEAALRDEVERVGLTQIAPLESHLRGLETIASLAPLLGLLGTVLGMISAFVELEQAGARVDTALLAGGIWEALLTTAVGLSIAIPTLAVLASLESQVERFRRRLSDAATQVLTAPALAAANGSRGDLPSADAAAQLSLSAGAAGAAPDAAAGSRDLVSGKTGGAGRAL